MQRIPCVPKFKSKPVPLDLLLKDEMRQTIEESVTVILVVKSYIQK